MRKVLIYIGGPSQSGKSTLARSISKATNLKHIDLDKCEEIISLQTLQDNSEKWEKLKRVAADCIRDLADHSVIEGSQLWPEDIVKQNLNSELCTSLFLGYPNIGASKKLCELEAGGFDNATHISDLAPADRLTKIEKYICDSRRMQKSTNDNEAKFVDFSTWEEFEATKEKLILSISNCLESQ